MGRALLTPIGGRQPDDRIAQTQERPMSVPFDPTTLLYAVVEHLPAASFLADPIDTPPTLAGQYRLVCLAI